jgi:hypothetical protein
MEQYAVALEMGPKRRVFAQVLAWIGWCFAPRRRYGFAWTPRFAVRRSAWHALDHAWELQERLDR